MAGLPSGPGATLSYLVDPTQEKFANELWARGYAVSTVGFELQQVHPYIRKQEEADGSGGQFGTHNQGAPRREA
jgi:hypothetical protein